MRICAISDLHGHLPGFVPRDTPPWKAGLMRQMPEIEQCDILLIAGDILPVWDHSIDAQLRHLQGPFRDWLRSVPARHIIGVAGNHDLVFENCPSELRDALDIPEWVYLQDGDTTIDERIDVTALGDSHPKFVGQCLKIWGSPWQPVFNNWAFNLPEQELAKKWAMIPDDIDILLLHGPPQGWGDSATDDRGCGSPSLRKRILEIKPKLTVFGHVHEGRGVWKEEWGTLANVSLLDRSYKSVHVPMYFDI